MSETLEKPKLRDKKNKQKKKRAFKHAVLQYKNVKHSIKSHATHSILVVADATRDLQFALSVLDDFRWSLSLAPRNASLDSAREFP